MIEEKCVQKEQTVFESFVSRLSGEVARTRELSNELRKKLDRIYPAEIGKEDCSEKKSPINDNTFHSNITESLYTLRDVNDLLAQNLSHLNKLV